MQVLTPVILSAVVCHPERSRRVSFYWLIGRCTFVSMKNFTLLSNILSKPWLIEESFLQSSLPLVMNMLKTNGEQDELGTLSKASCMYAVDASSTRSKEFNQAPPGSVAIIQMRGPLMKNDQFCGPVGTTTIGTWIQQALTNPNIDGIVLDTDSPGGTVDGTESLASIIKNSKKPIVTYVDGMMASAAYWIGSASSEIIAHGKTAFIGSIGTMTSFADYSGMLEQAGIKVRDIYASASTDKNRAHRAAQEGNDALIVSDILDPLNSVFTSAVKSNRLGKLSQKEDVLTGKIYLAADAKKYGLIDSIGTLQDAIKSVRQKSQTKKYHE